MKQKKMKNEKSPTAGQKVAPPSASGSPSGTADLEQQLAFVTWSFFDLIESPFTNEPYHRFFFLSESTESAVSSAMYAPARRKSFIVITGGRGVGKSMLCHILLSQLNTEAQHAILLSASPVTESLSFVSESGDCWPLTTDLHSLLRPEAGRERGRIVIVDDAHNLSSSQLKELVSLAEEGGKGTGETKIILVAYPVIKEVLVQSAHRLLAANIAVRTSLRALSRKQTFEYVRHRVKVAAEEEVPDLFSSVALWALDYYSDGVPRRINRISSTALVDAFSRKRKRVGFFMVRRASRRLGITKRLSRKPLAAALAFLLVGAAAAGLYNRLSRETVAHRTREAAVTESASPVPAPASPAADFTVDADGIMRVGAPEESLKGSLATLFRLWGMEYLAGESLSWRIFNFNPALLQVFFQETGIFRQYGIELHAVEASMTTINRLGLPCIFSYRLPGADEGTLQYAVIGGYRDGNVIISDPLGGRREVPLGSWQTDLVGPVYYLYKGTRPFTPLGPGSLGTDVVLLQEELKEAGLFKETPTGTYGPETRRAVQELQRIHDLEPSGLADLTARLALLRSGRHPVPAFMR